LGRGDDMRIICFKIKEDELERLDRLAVRLKKSRSEVIREAINEYVGKHKKELKNVRVKEVVKL
jgi:metal-responsive CopG/Arc/MetJ family transcriptional regulator